MKSNNKNLTEVYFIRHAQADNTVRDGRIRPLTPKGINDAEKLPDIFKNISVDRIYSSPFKRAIDTVTPIAEALQKNITIIEDFRERRSDSIQTIPMPKLIKMQWNDFTYTLSDGECLHEVQRRNIDALNRVIAENNQKRIIIGTHGMALCTIMRYYRDLDIENVERILLTLPYIIRMDFIDGIFSDMIEMSEINISFA